MRVSVWCVVNDAMGYPSWPTGDDNERIISNFSVGQLLAPRPDVALYYINHDEATIATLLADEDFTLEEVLPDATDEG